MTSIETVSEKCIECKLCQKECKFLEKYGNPKSIADSFDPAHKKHRATAFECSLCGLCAVVCPVNVNPAQMFMEMRQEVFRLGLGDYPEHSKILDYEKRGTSRRYSYYALPEGCDTVFFPGCTLPGTRPDKVMKLFEHLRQTVPSLGIVLDCCTKPSRDLGRQDHFRSMYGEMEGFLRQNGVRHVLVACPNCYKVFKQHAETISVRTVYELLAESGLPEAATISGTVTVHDPCAVRFEDSIHNAVRGLIEKKGLTVEEMPHHGSKTLCCGEGGSVGFLAPELARNWSAVRAREAGGRRIISYCAGCVNFLNAVTPTTHVLDIIFDPEAAIEGKAGVSRAPLTYWNRIRLKGKFPGKVDAAVTRERVFAPEMRGAKGSLVFRVLLVAAMLGAILAVRMTGAGRYLEQDTLRSLIEGYGVLAPILYMLVYTAAPALFLPGLPITIAGGILFRPFWGVVYTITGATLGACLAFLISRYLAREWIEGKLKSPRWKKLDEGVDRHGWKVVAFTRLIPLFPFNLLNYAFGLTKVKFLHYAVATFICMLPACIAFIVFSSSLLDIVKGRVSPAFVVGAGLILGVMLIPFLYKRYKAAKKEEMDFIKFKLRSV